MGLDVCAVKNAVMVTDPKVSEVDDLDQVFGGHFPERLGSLVDGAYYDGEVTDAHYSNGYSRHSAFREELAKLARYPAKKLEKPSYDDPDFMNKNFEYMRPYYAAACEIGEGPFFEVLMFSDCEGYIGPEVCAKIAEDFRRFADAAEATDDEWFKRSYFDLKECFEDGAQNGYVRFG